MTIARTAIAALRVDALRLGRDRFLVGTGLYLVGISVAMRWVIPWARRGVASRWAFDLTPLYGLLISHFVIQLAPLLIGVIGAFLLLESREERTIKALLVSPVPLHGYLLWGCGVMVAASTLLVVIEAPIIGLGLPPWPALVATGIAGSLIAPVFALSVAALADNKTEAFAYLKVLGVLPLLVSGSYFLAEPLQWVAVVYPPYLAAKAYWIAEAGEAGWPLWTLAAGVVSAVWISGSMRLFIRAAHR